jgi:hypothetical protein
MYWLTMLCVQAWPRLVSCLSVDCWVIGSWFAVVQVMDVASLFSQPLPSKRDARAVHDAADCRGFGKGEALIQPATPGLWPLLWIIVHRGEATRGICLKKWRGRRGWWWRVAHAHDYFGGLVAPRSAPCLDLPAALQKLVLIPCLLH